MFVFDKSLIFQQNEKKRKTENKRNLVKPERTLTRIWIRKKLFCECSQSRRDSIKLVGIVGKVCYGGFRGNANFPYSIHRRIRFLVLGMVLSVIRFTSCCFGSFCKTKLEFLCQVLQFYKFYSEQRDAVRLLSGEIRGNNYDITTKFLVIILNTFSADSGNLNTLGR